MKTEKSITDKLPTEGQTSHDNHTRLADARIIPILFSTPMVQAILDGRKTQTRRVAKLQPDGLQMKIDNVCRDWNHIFKGYPKDRDIDIWSFGKCPYGKVGDILWVRESFYEPLFLGLNGKYYYKADVETQGWDFKWKPSLFMPKDACRIFLQVKSVRVEQLQSISETAAHNEGVAEIQADDDMPRGLWKSYDSKRGYTLSARASFESLWNSINGIESWSQNPWVWVVEFERTQRPTGFY